MAIKSVLFTREEIDNKDKKFGAAATYQPIWVVDDSGNYSFALFTSRELETALERGKKNPEDEVPPMPLFKKVWDRFLRTIKVR